MSKRNRGRHDHGDPRRAGGDIAGPGGPSERDSVIIDARDAVLLDHFTSAAILPADRTENGVVFRDEPVRATLLMEGRINKTDERSKVLYLMSVEAAADLAAEIVALTMRAGEDVSAEFTARFTSRLAELPKEGV